MALRCSAAAADRDPRRTTTAAGTAGDYDLSVALEDILIFDVNKFNNLKIDEHELETFTSDWSWQLHNMTSDTQKTSCPICFFFQAQFMVKITGLMAWNPGSHPHHWIGGETRIRMQGCLNLEVAMLC